MNSMEIIINGLRSWSLPKEAVHGGEKCPFLLTCLLFPPSNLGNVISDLDVGRDLKAFWLISDGADLFKDEKYGQWGLRILPADHVALRSLRDNSVSDDRLRENDFVIGEFYGDSEQLLIDASNASQDEYPVFIKLPLDERSAWPRVASSFGHFLERYLAEEGSKYWEQ